LSIPRGETNGIDHPILALCRSIFLGLCRSIRAKSMFDTATQETAWSAELQHR
jgi:hypothetical protein